MQNNFDCELKYHRRYFLKKASNLEGILASDLAVYIHVFYEKQWKIQRQKIKILEGL